MTRRTSTTLFTSALSVLLAAGLLAGARAQNATDDARKAAFTAAVESAAAAHLDEIDGPSKSAVGDGAVAIPNHINGMAIAGDWYVVNYPNVGRHVGRLLFWNKATGDWADVRTFGMAADPNDDSTGDGFPAGMDASGQFVAVATGNSGLVKFFDFSHPASGVDELTNQQIKAGDGMVEDIGLAFDRYLGRYVVYAENKLWVAASRGQDLSKNTGWISVTVAGDRIPHGEGGTPLRFLGGDLFAVFSLGSDVDDDPYSFRLSYLTLAAQHHGQASDTYTADVTLTDAQYTFAHKGEAGGAPSFRWAGTATTVNNGGHYTVDLYAAPKRLDGAGDYYEWSSGKIDYVVHIKTADVSGAGTDSNISLTIVGDRGSTTEQVTNPLISGNAYERGQIDTFTLTDIDVGEITSVIVRSDGKYAGSDWNVQAITIDKGSKEYAASPRAWITDTDPHTFRIDDVVPN